MSLDDIKDFVNVVLSYEFEKIEGEKKEEKINYIISSFQNNEKFREFFELLSRLDGVNINKACKYLNETFNLPVDELRKIKRKTTLLLTLYKHNLIDEIDSIVFATSIEKFRTKWRFTLSVTPKRDLKDINTSLIEFCKNWNKSNVDLVFAEPVSTKDILLMIRILKETGRKTPKQFKFRREGRLPQEITREEFRVETVEHYPLSFKHVYIRKIDEDTFELIFNFNPQEEKRLVEELLSAVFGLDIKIDQLIYSKPKVVEVMEKTSKSLFAEIKNKGLDEAKKEIEKMRRVAIEKAEQLNLPVKKKEKLKEIINTIHPLPPKITNALEKGIISLEQIVDPEVFPRHPVGRQILEGAYKLAEEIEDERKMYPYFVNRKPIVILPNGMIKAQRIGELDMLALKLFFGVRDEGGQDSSNHSETR